MVGTDKTRREITRETQRLIKNLSRRIPRIERRFGGELNFATSAVRSWDYLKVKYLYELDRDTGELTRKPLNKLSDRDLLDLYRRLNDLDRNESSTVKGVEQKVKNWSPIQRAFDRMGDYGRDKVFRIYEKVRELYPSTDKIKYETIQVITDIVENSGSLYDEDTIVRAVKEWAEHEQERQYEQLFTDSIGDRDGLSTPFTIDQFLPDPYDDLF